MTVGVRRTAAAASATAVLAVTAGFASTAHAEAYRYWSYWKWEGSGWVYQHVGPNASTRDGDVIGWRFAEQPDSSSGQPPRVAGEFTALCGDRDGVGVVIDYGVPSHAPPGESPPGPRGFCATDETSNGYRATDEHATLRFRNDGLVCGIDGYPRTECGAKVEDEPAADAPEPDRTGADGRRPDGDANRDRAPSGAERRGPGGGAAAGAGTEGEDDGAPGPDPTGSTVRVPGESAQPEPSPGRPSPTLDVTVVEPATADPVADDELPIGPVVGGAAIVLLGSAAFWQYRRNAG